MTCIYVRKGCFVTKKRKSYRSRVMQLNVWFDRRAWHLGIFGETAALYGGKRRIRFLPCIAYLMAAVEKTRPTDMYTA